MFERAAFGRPRSACPRINTSVLPEEVIRKMKIVGRKSRAENLRTLNSGICWRLSYQDSSGCIIQVSLD